MEVLWGQPSLINNFWVRFILDIDKIFWFRDFMSNFRKMLRKGSAKAPEKFKPLKYEHIMHHFKAHDLEIPLIQIISQNI